VDGSTRKKKKREATWGGEGALTSVGHLDTRAKNNYAPMVKQSGTEPGERRGEGPETLGNAIVVQKEGNEKESFDDSKK